MAPVFPPSTSQLRRALPTVLGSSALLLVTALLTRTLIPALIFAALLGLTLAARQVLRGQARQFAALCLGAVTAISGLGLVLTISGKLLVALTLVLLCAAIAGAGIWAVRRFLPPSNHADHHAVGALETGQADIDWGEGTRAQVGKTRG